MNITIPAEALADAVNKVAAVTERTRLLPILANIKIDIEDGFFKVTATDLEMTVIQVVNTGVAVSETASFLVHGRIFSDILKTLEKGELTLEIKENKLHISQKNSVFDLALADLDEYPEIKEVKADSVFSMTSAELLSLLKVSYAMSSDETRPGLNGICLASNDVVLEAVASDGLRLAYRKLEKPNAGVFKRIIPSRTVHEVSKLPDSATLSIRHSGTEMSLTVPEQGLEIRSRLVDAVYPDYESIISTASIATKLTLNKSDILKAVKQISMISDGDPLVIERNGGSGIVVKTESTVGSAKADVAIDSCTGEPLPTLAFNTKMLLQVISSFSDVISWGIPEGYGPSFMREETAGSIAVLMPIKI